MVVGGLDKRTSWSDLVGVRQLLWMISVPKTLPKQIENRKFCHLRLIFLTSWVISAAHCFCALNEHVECTLMNRGFSKQLSQTDEVYGKGFNERLVQVLIWKELSLFSITGSR